MATWNRQKQQRLAQFRRSFRWCIQPLVAVVARGEGCSITPLQTCRDPPLHRTLVLLARWNEPGQRAHLFTAVQLPTTLS